VRRRANPDYWIAKIDYNRSRDQEQTEALKDQGWTVIRLWETEVMSQLDAAVETVVGALGK